MSWPSVVSNTFIENFPVLSPDHFGSKVIDMYEYEQVAGLRFPNLTPLALKISFELASTLRVP